MHKRNDSLQRGDFMRTDSNRKHKARARQTRDRTERDQEGSKRGQRFESKCENELPQLIGRYFERLPGNEYKQHSVTQHAVVVAVAAAVGDAVVLKRRINKRDAKHPPRIRFRAAAPITAWARYVELGLARAVTGSACAAHSPASTTYAVATEKTGADGPRNPPNPA
mmetsp:Transcript_16825/g.36526  ORF Transcript_16825/g.36526 Transcript_16825/m.36526 type:complete len:167 (+) Transcript_16825:112-612(+)